MRLWKYLATIALLVAIVTVDPVFAEDEDNQDVIDVGDSVHEVDTGIWSVGYGHSIAAGLNVRKLNSNILTMFSVVLAEFDLIALMQIRERDGDITNGIPDSATEIVQALSEHTGTEYKVISSPRSGGNGVADRTPYECRDHEQTVYIWKDASIKNIGSYAHQDTENLFYSNPYSAAWQVVLGHDADALDRGSSIFEFNTVTLRADSDPYRDPNVNDPNRLKIELGSLDLAVNRAIENLSGDRPTFAQGTWFADCNKISAADFAAIPYLANGMGEVLNEGRTTRKANCRYDMIAGDEDVVQAKEAGDIEIATLPVTSLGVAEQQADAISDHEPVRATLYFTKKTFAPNNGNLWLVLIAASAVAGAILGGAYYARQKAIENDELLYGGMSSKGSISEAGEKGGFVGAGGVARPATAVSGVSSYTRGGAPGPAGGERTSGVTSLTRGDALGMGGRSTGSRSSKSSKSSKSRSSKGSHGRRHSKGSRSSKSGKSSGSRSGSSSNRMTALTGFTRGGSTGGLEGASRGTRGSSGTSASHVSKGSRSSGNSKSSRGSKATHASKATRSSSGSGR